jgi:hypothetical protein
MKTPKRVLLNARDLHVLKAFKKEAEELAKSAEKEWSLSFSLKYDPNLKSHQLLVTWRDMKHRKREPFESMVSYGFKISRTVESLGEAFDPPLREKKPLGEHFANVGWHAWLKALSDARGLLFFDHENPPTGENGLNTLGNLPKWLAKKWAKDNFRRGFEAESEYEKKRLVAVSTLGAKRQTRNKVL